MRKLNVVMAVFNEVQTVRQAIEGVLALDLKDIDLRLIVVESNSSDGTREIVEGYLNCPRVTIIFEACPLGKGAAIRHGLGLITDGLVLIQDADLEYSFDDYPALLEPITSDRAKFVLGSRHNQTRPMRNFRDATFVSGLMNAAHRVFTLLFNVVYRTQLRDPFTMFKVFDSHCIAGLHFTSNRFDFDWELVAKLVRRGFMPIEVPVTYHSRGFDAGKKIRFVRDPLTWLVALIKFRFVQINSADSE